MNDQLRSLQNVTQIILDAELAKLRRLSDETRLRQEKLAELVAVRAARSVEVQNGNASKDLAFQTGQDGRWQAWVARANSRLTREAADAAARREAQRMKAQRAFGRVDALARIRALEDDARKQRKARRLLAEAGGSDAAG